MKKWIIAGSILLVLIAGVVLALVNLNTLINRNKEYLLAQAKEALGRDVEVAKVGVSLWGGIGARLKQFSVADDASFSKEPFVRAADLQVNLKLLPLLRGDFQIDKLVLNKPVINMVRNEKGQFNFSSIGVDQKKTPKEREKERRDRSERRTPPALLISLLEVDGGTVNYIDKARGINFQATDLDIGVKELAYDQPIPLEIKAAVFGSKKQNLETKGRVGPVGVKQDVAELPVDGEVELQPVSFESFEKAVPGLLQRLPRDLRLAGLAGAKIRVSGPIKDVLSRASGTLNLSNFSARVPQLAQPITDVNTKITFSGKNAEVPETAFRIGKSQVRLAARAASFTPLNLTFRVSSPELYLADLQTSSEPQQKPEVLKDVKSEGTVVVNNGVLGYRGTLNSASGTIVGGDYTNLQSVTSYSRGIATIESLKLGAFGGTLAGTGRYDIRDAVPRFSAATNVNRMDVAQIFKSLAPSGPQNLQGLINLDLDVTGAGKDWESIKKALKGKAKTEVLDGKLVDVNLAESVLSGATGFAGAINLIPADVRSKYPSIFNSKDTDFKQLKGTATISDGRAQTEDLIVSAAEFESQAKGWVGFDRTVALNGVLFLSQRLSQDIVNRARETKALANEQGRIELPYSLNGKLPGAKPKPDLGYIARAMQKGAVEEGLDRLFRRKSRKGDSESSPPGDQTPSQAKEKRRKEPQEEILRRFEGLFKR